MNELVKGLKACVNALESGKPIKVTTVGPGVRREETLTLEQLREKNWAFYAEVGRRVQLLRVDKRLTVKELARRADLQEFHVQKLEAGTLPVTDRIVTKVAKGLGVGKSEIHASYNDEDHN